MECHVRVFDHCSTDSCIINPSPITNRFVKSMKAVSKGGVDWRGWHRWENPWISGLAGLAGVIFFGAWAGRVLGSYCGVSETSYPLLANSLNETMWNFLLWILWIFLVPREVTAIETCKEARCPPPQKGHISSSKPFVWQKGDFFTKFRGVSCWLPGGAIKKRGVRWHQKVKTNLGKGTRMTSDARKSSGDIFCGCKGKLRLQKMVMKFWTVGELWSNFPRITQVLNYKPLFQKHYFQNLEVLSTWSIVTWAMCSRFCFEKKHLLLWKTVHDLKLQEPFLVSPKPFLFTFALRFRCSGVSLLDQQKNPEMVTS